MSRSRIGIIGLGAVSAMHIPAIGQLDAVDITAVCDRDAAKVEKVAQQIGARGFVDSSEFFAHAGFDLVLVLTPAATHRALVEEAAASGCHVICEKPMATSLADAEAMIAAIVEVLREDSAC